MEYRPSSEINLHSLRRPVVCSSVLFQIIFKFCYSRPQKRWISTLRNFAEFPLKSPHNSGHGFCGTELKERRCARGLSRHFTAISTVAFTVAFIKLLLSHATQYSAFLFQSCKFYIRSLCKFVKYISEKFASYVSYILKCCKLTRDIN